VGNIVRCTYDGQVVLVLGEPVREGLAYDICWVTPVLLLWDRWPRLKKITWWVYEAHILASPWTGVGTNRRIYVNQNILDRAVIAGRVEGDASDRLP